LVVTGTISNAGNITLTDVNVYSSILGAEHPVLGLAGLAPGEVIPYTATFSAPEDFCEPDTMTVEALSICGDVKVSDTVTSSCPVVTTPGIAVSRTCPVEPVLKGKPVTFTAFVVNTGDVTLTNVTVANTLPQSNQLVFGPVTLGPGQGTNFTYTYTTAMDCNCCELVDMLTARGQDRCSGRPVATTSTTVCRYETHPSITVSLDCPTSGGGFGDVLAFSGIVMNNGDTPLTNVIVMGSGPAANTRLVGPITLARGETQDFAGSYTVDGETPPLSTLVVEATGTDPCSRLFVSARQNCEGPDNPLVPVLSAPVISGSQVTLTWTAVRGFTYRVLFKTSLSDANWISIDGDVIAQGDTASKVVNYYPGTRYYRLVVTSY
jgi:uncharacterized repeat protein (TIGR01451 family)